MERAPTTYETGDLNLEATELRLALPGRENNEPSTSTTPKTNNKRPSSEIVEDDDNNITQDCLPPRPKAQVVGWPPVRSYRRNASALQQGRRSSAECGGGGGFVKVSMDGAAYLRKIDVKGYKSYGELLKGLEKIFTCSFGAYSEREGYDGSEYAPTYEDKDGDWMLLGDVPWDMFLTSCTRLRVMKASETKGLGASIVN